MKRKHPPYRVIWNPDNVPLEAIAQNFAKAVLLAEELREERKAKAAQAEKQAA
jgi:hypothetical protein